MWSLEIVKGAELAENLRPRMRLPQPLKRFSIGRDPANPWAITDLTLALSARHCEIVDTPAGPVLRDLSTNGTFVNHGQERMAGDHPLRNGDLIEIGPFVIQVSGPAMPDRPASTAPAAAAAVAAPRRSPGVFETAPHRGGDPAAMLAAGDAGAAPGLTEILRVAPAAADSSVDMTRIRLAQPGAKTPRAELAGAAAAAPTAMSTPAPSFSSAASLESQSALTQALARGLGVPVAALAGQDPLQQVERLAAVARESLAALRDLLEQQSQSQRRIGSRQSVATPLREANPLRAATSAEAALLELISGANDAPAAVQRSLHSLRTHQDQLLSAFEQSMRSLAAQIEPAAIESVLGQRADANPAHLWALYVTLWDGMGMSPKGAWADAFRDAALQHLAAAYGDAAP